MKQFHLFTALKGLCIGGTMLVPGVSGGSMAIILGIYDQLVSSVSSFFKHKRKSAVFLGIFCLGALIGMILFARPLLHLIENYPKPMMFFFMGAVAGSAPMIYRKGGSHSACWQDGMFFLLGLALIVLLSLFPKTSFEMTANDQYVYFLLVLSGFLAAIALVLPGISVSYMLLLLGMYDTTMRAFETFYLPYLLPLGIGLILGIFATTKLLECAMTQYPRQTYRIILGFILGSVVEIFPGLPSGIEILLCAILLTAGFVIIYYLSSKEESATPSSSSQEK